MQLTISGTLTAADVEERTITGVLLPYGEPGRTNRGRVTAARGCLTLPAAGTLLVGNLDHDRNKPAAKATAITDAADALRITWSVPPTPNGDLLLAEAAAGLRTGMSVELDDTVIRDGALVAGTLTAVGFVTEPAFPSARITDLMVAQDAGDLAPDSGPPTTDPDPSVTESVDTYVDPDTGETVTVTTRREPPTSEIDPGTTEPKGTTTVTTPASAPTDLTASATARAGRLTASTIRTPRDLFRLLAQAHSRGDHRLLAALSDITSTGMTDREVPQWVAELWSGIPYQRRIVPLVNAGELTSMKVHGWRWVVKPVMASWAGDKTAVPSGTVDTEPVEVDAKRLAGAHDIDRKFRDFGDESFFASYYQAMAESYAKLSDAALVVDLKAGAGAPIAVGAVPAGIAAEWAALVDAALDIIDVGAPSFALVEKSVYRALVLTPKDKAFEFLSTSLGLTEGQLSGFRIIPVATTAVGTAASTGLDKGEILVGAKQAATFHELGGGAPIRAEAIDMVKGGVDAGCFGYYATVVHDARALSLVDLTADV